MVKIEYRSSTILRQWSVAWSSELLARLRCASAVINYAIRGDFKGWSENSSHTFDWCIISPIPKVIAISYVKQIKKEKGKGCKSPFFLLAIAQYLLFLRHFACLSMLWAYLNSQTFSLNLTPSLICNVPNNSGLEVI